MPDYENEKRIAAHAAIEKIEEGMVIGLGSGSTAAYAIRAIGELVSKGKKIVGVPTSVESEALARSVRIPLTTLDDHPTLDLTVDGADKFSQNLDLIKGGGGALLREKIVAAASQRILIIVDSRKQENPLGGFPVPVEVIPFGVLPIMKRFNELNLKPKIRRQKSKTYLPFITDEGNLIVDLDVENIPCIKTLTHQLDFPGVVEHGLFLDLADEVYMGVGDQVEVFHRKS